MIVRSCSTSAKITSMSLRGTRGARIWLIVIGLGAGVLAANWVAITVHVSNLRASAARASGDSAPELRAQADDFHSAQTAFAALTIAAIVRFVVLVALWMRRSGSSAAADPGSAAPPVYSPEV